ncbi:hypothetical protein NQ314_015413, partial [Rhamnusium bicolor]
VNKSEAKPQFTKVPISTSPRSLRKSPDLRQKTSVQVTSFQLFKPQIPSIEGPPACANGYTFCENIDSLHGPCDIIGEVPEFFITSCKQKFVYSRLLSLSDLGSPSPDTFQLPSACCCAYKKNSKFLQNYGTPFTPTRV